jgi:hypothetical protein
LTIWLLKIKNEKEKRKNKKKETSLRGRSPKQSGKIKNKKLKINKK